MAIVVSVLLGLFAMGIVPSVWLLLTERRWRDAWPVETVSHARLDQGAYRTVEQRTELRGAHAPTLIRLIAWTCFLFGQMFVPGLLAGLFGLIAYGLGLLSIPGLILAWRLFGLGTAMLRRDADVPSRARQLASFATTLNVIILGIVALAVLISRDPRWLLVALPYPLMSIAHAMLLRHVAERFEQLGVHPLREPLTLAVATA